VTVKEVAPHVLLLPGNMCDARLWSGGGNALTTALLGLGLTADHVDFGQDISITYMAKRALSVHDGPLVLIGFSMGGIVALEMARIAAKRITALCLIDTTANADTRGPLRLRQQEAVASGELVRVVVEEMKPAYLARCHRQDQALLAVLRDMAVDMGAAVFTSQSEALRKRADLTPVLAGLAMPVMLACGQEDTMCTPAMHQAMANQIGDATLTIVPNAGHILPLEQPAILAKLITQFLTTKRGTYP
jgi:pimeloyl-ACP methyl ester carboxylesterase